MRELGRKAKTVLQNPRYTESAINRTLNRCIHMRFGKRRYYPQGHDVFEEDWDNLIILDACRYDALANRMDRLPGHLEKRRSRGSCSREWVAGNFDRRLHDVVYLSTNLFYSRLNDEGDIDGELHAFHSVHEEAGWENHGPYGMGPETTTEQAKRLNERYPNKRFIVHYMNPHTPFIGEFGRSFSGPDDTPEAICRSDKPGFTVGRVRKAYSENLDIVLEHVSDLMPELKGKTVISADHGELLGERVGPIPVREWGHPKGTYVDTLLDIPWLVIEGDTRKRIVAEPPVEGDGAEQLDPEYVNQRLRDLGYAE